MKRTRLKKGDEVVVIAGKDKGKRGSILRVMPDDGRVLVENVNMIKRHTKPGRDNEGGIVEKEASIHISNVMYYDTTASKGTRITVRTLEDGRKVRVAAASGEVLDS
ncbi:MAG: 50S ribosomal protein L24 [Magnetococcales bacterium]|nr:50S ribosomal protein L24 [Magnetococcales bacterium]